MPELCGHCHKPVERLIDGLCGICDITRAKRAPAFNGQDYSGQIDPDNYDPAKEFKLGLKSLENHPDPKQRLTPEQKKSYEKYLLQPALQQSHYMKTNARALAAERRAQDQEIAVQERQIQAEANVVKDKLGQMIGEARATGKKVPFESG